MRTRVLLLIVLSVFCLSEINAQKNNKKITITGTVLDASGKPIMNGIVMIDNQKSSTLTDAAGNYRIKVKPTALKIGIVTLGQGMAEELIGDRTRIDFNFGTSKVNNPESNIKPGEEGINTGYGSVKQKNLTTTVNKIDGTNKKYASYSSIYDMIQREVSGVRIRGTSAIIQGSKDLFGDVSALIVVDGVSMDDIPDIAPTSVKSIEVLKGTAAAIYGSRGYGGVIIIKTKLQNE